MRSTLLLLALAGSVPAFAQVPVSLVGRVERQTNGCNAAAGYRVSCSQTQLVSTAVDLANYVNQTVQLDGTADLANPKCPTVTVTAVAPPVASTRVTALLGYRLGSPLLFTTNVAAGGLVAYVFSTDSALVPIPMFGTYQLDVLGSVFWTFDLSIGVAIRSVSIPRDTFLIGQRILFQTAYAVLTPELSAGLLNLNCFTITQ